jgi:hypothetical protein
LKAVGVPLIDDLRRECEKKQAGRRAACPLFWTLGANQVGKGAIVGWRDVLAPALREGDVSLWPFDGRLLDLLKAGKIIIAETYPAECYGWFFREPLNGSTQHSTEVTADQNQFPFATLIKNEPGERPSNAKSRTRS